MPVLFDENGVMPGHLATGGGNAKSIVMDSAGTIVFKASHSGNNAENAVKDLLSQ